ENPALPEELLRRAREAGAGEERTRLAREVHDTVAQGPVGVTRQPAAVPRAGPDEAAPPRIPPAPDAARATPGDARAPAGAPALQEELLRRAREAGAGEERTRLAREIHDTVAQGLVGVIRQLEAVPVAGLDEAARLRIATAEDAARECLVDARRAVEALAPQQLAAGGDLVDVLGELVGRWARTHRVVATFDADHAPRPCPHGHALIRVTQEALANIARHARARTVEITLTGDPGTVTLRIADDGRG